MYFLHTGSSLLNLALTGDIYGGYPVGRISNVVGDKSTGKTLLAIEAATLLLSNPPKGLKPAVYYHEAEAAFDKEYAAGLGLPIDKIKFSEGKTIEKFYGVLEGLFNNDKGKTINLVVLDSLDGLTDVKEEEKKFGEQDYSRKSQKLGELFRKSVRDMERTNTHLMILSQIRENINALPFSPKWKRSGGKSLDFFATHIFWLAETKKLKSSKTNLVYGIDVNMKVTKNKVSVPYRDVSVPIIFRYGVDDIASMLNYLTDKILPKEVRINKATGGIFEYEGKRLRLNEMVGFVEDNPDILKKLKERCQLGWNEMEAMTFVPRKSKVDLLK